MAKTPPAIKNDPRLRELKALLRQGLSVDAATLCPTLMSSEEIHGDDPDRQPPEERSRRIVDRVTEVLDEIEFPPDKNLNITSRHALFAPGDGIETRRQAVAREEQLSSSTLKRREMLMILGVATGLGFDTPKAAAAELPSPVGIDLSGEWIAVWQTTVYEEENHNHEVVCIEQHGKTVDIYNDAASEENPDGGYLWRGTLTAHSDRTVLGYYASAQNDVVARGTLYYVVNPNGRYMEGRWVGLNIDREVNTGISVLARDRPTADRCFERLLKKQSDIYPPKEQHD